MKTYYRSMTLALIALVMAAVAAVKLVKTVYAQPVIQKVIVLQPKDISRAECSQGTVPGQGPDKGKTIYIGCAVFVK